MDGRFYVVKTEYNEEGSKTILADGPFNEDKASDFEQYANRNIGAYEYFSTISEHEYKEMSQEGWFGKFVPYYPNGESVHDGLYPPG